MLKTRALTLSVAAGLALVASRSMAAAIGLEVTDPNNGLTDIYSATFDGALIACGVGSSTYCTFFGGDPGTARSVEVVPDPTGVQNAVPGGIGPGGIPAAPPPASGSFLDLTLSAGNTLLTLGDQTAGTGDSTVTFADFNICIDEVGMTTGCGRINAQADNGGMVFNPTGPVNGNPRTPAGGGSTGDTVPVDSNGRAVFQVQNGGAVVVDFSRFSQVVTSCTGSFCPLVTGDALNLDIIRYVLEIDFESDFSSFTGNFIGQTSNNSLVYATLNSVFIPLPAAGWLMIPAVGAVLARARRRRAGQGCA